MASLLAGIGSALLPMVIDGAKTLLPGLGKGLAGIGGNVLESISPDAKEAFCGCKKEDKKEDKKEPKEVDVMAMTEDEFNDYDANRYRPKQYGRSFQNGRIDYAPRRKKHLRR